ncbi:CARDB domain-containing protein, partial [Microcystis sp. T1-4]|uniref:CARDB domain-containing protein n=1 Tax=Microcystis sp. T1-4 TaxID=1160279 RepID=UPI000586527C
VADRNNNQGESNDNNNTFAVPITLDAPDLVVTEVTAPTSATLGESIEVSWTVTNQGTGTANQDWYDYVYVSTDQIYDSSDTYLTGEYISSQTPLAADGSYTITRNVTLPSTATGDRYLLFVADRNNNQGESNDNNNTFAVPITLDVADLVVTDATAPTTATLGESIEVSWTV